MKPYKTAAVLVAMVIAGTLLLRAQGRQTVFDLKHRQNISMADMIADLKEKRIIVVGEHHSNKEHHLAQLAVIQSLHEAGMRMAVGLEMFRSDSQDALDRYIAGDLTNEEFQPVYYDNWNLDWSLYEPIFAYAREQKIPLIGLNVPREITRQVARKGFQSLDPQQRGKLYDIACRVDQDYMEYIQKAYGAHAHGDMNFTYFCEAQMVWDTVMAVHAIEYLDANPDAVVVILTGNGHAQKGAVPRQINNRSPYPVAVILPEVPGSIDPKTLSERDADYIMLNLAN
jgi:uncharacterized iron-regulated protein